MRRATYNTVVVLGTSDLQFYRKNHLVPFGETIPLKPILGWFIRSVLHIPLADQSRGGATQPALAVAGEHVAVDICYEDAFGAELIHGARDANLLVNVTNDAWYGRSIAAQQHNQIAAMRALEFARPMLRATNTGITSAIGHDGREIARLPWFTTGVLEVAVAGRTGDNAVHARRRHRGARAVRRADRRGDRVRRGAGRIAATSPSWPTIASRMHTFQQVILALQRYWADQRLRAAAALRHGSRRRHVAHGDVPARARPGAVARRVRAAVAPPEGRPLRREPEPPAALLPVPGRAEALAAGHPRPLSRLARRRSASISRKNDVRFVEDDWENPTLGAWGLGWEVWLNGMEITQFTYFQQVGGLDCNPITGEITYGLERLAMYLQGKENVFDLVWTTMREGGVERDADVRRRLSPERGRAVDVQLRAVERAEARPSQFALFESEATRLSTRSCRCPATR